MQHAFTACCHERLAWLLRMHGEQPQHAAKLGRAQELRVCAGGGVDRRVGIASRQQLGEQARWQLQNAHLQLRVDGVLGLLSTDVCQSTSIRAIEGRCVGTARKGDDEAEPVSPTWILATFSLAPTTINSALAHATRP